MSSSLYGLAPDVLAILRADPWFGSRPAGFEADWLSVGQVRRFQAGEHLFWRGDPPDGLYALIEGTVRVSGVTEAGKEAILAVAEPPNWFGEISLFDGLPRTHNAVADGVVRALHVPQAEALALLARVPAYWHDLGVLMALRLRLTFIGIEDLALLPAEARLARRLVWLVEGAGMAPDAHGCVLPINQTQLGMMLSLSRQTTNQILQALQERGVLRVAYGRIEVLDRAGLMAQARLSATEQRILEHRGAAASARQAPGQSGAASAS